MVIAKSKKVKPPMNNTILNMDWTNAPDPPNNQDTGVASAIFIPHANSLPFEERHVTLEQPVKIGRNVYRATPSPTNTIFECRVLSRHHATLYYDKGHFFLVDNQSSNGTFINNNRCSISKEQEPHEVFSGDVVQFGIPVVENSSNSEKNTFPPVVALLKLIHPDGKEAKLSFNPTMTTPLHLKELYQLNNFVQEAIQREASLESRLRTLRECVERTRAEAQASWELFVGEQRLLMRVHTLESMLAVGKQPDSHHVAQLVSDKRNYQEVAQESLRSAHEQRLALEESLERRNREAAALHHHNCSLRLAANNARAELQKLAERCERKMCAARLAIGAAEEREQTLRNQLPLVYSVQNGEGKMLIISSDSNKLQDANHVGSIEEAIRALPDYVKLLLPQHLLNKVGIKAISTDEKSTEDIVNMKNDVMNTLSKEKATDDGVSVSEPEKSESPNSCTDDEKQSRLNHEPNNEIESSSPVEGELRSDNNANSVHSEPENKDDDSGKGIEYANILRIMAGLNEEIKTLRERLNSTTAENDQLRTVRDELLAAQTDARDDPISTVEPEDANTYRTRIADLQAQLTRTTVAEEANVAEIQRLASSTAELQAELAFRPTRADIDDLTLVVGQLRAELIAKEQQIKQLTKPKSTVERSAETSSSLEDLRKIEAGDESSEPNLDTGKISAEIDEMFRLDYDDDEDTDSVATEIANEAVENIADTSSIASEFVKLDDEERLQVTMQNGSLHALEEELVRAKEKWAEVSAERARLSAQLAALQSKSLKMDITHIIALAVPILLAWVYFALLPYIS